MKASLVCINGEEQIVQTELEGDAYMAFEALGTQAPPRLLDNNPCH
ncbi:hypothetical protein [Virgibacillus dokdonensis]|nr:hypothetical protein [Virgibacillus dokdonensis]